MSYEIIIPDKNGHKRYYDLKFNEYIKHRRIDVEDICIIDVTKFNDHNYTLRCFFYKTKHIGYIDNIPSKKEVYKFIREYLESHIYRFAQQYPGETV